MPSDVPTPSVLEVVTFVGKSFGAGAALTAGLYLLRRVCLIMAWKSGGTSQAELVNNLRSECYVDIHNPEEEIHCTPKCCFSCCSSRFLQTCLQACQLLPMLASTSQHCTTLTCKRQRCNQLHQLQWYSRGPVAYIHPVFWQIVKYKVLNQHRYPEDKSAT